MIVFEAWFLDKAAKGSSRVGESQASQKNAISQKQ